MRYRDCSGEQCLIKRMDSSLIPQGSSYYISVPKKNSKKPVIKHKNLKKVSRKRRSITKKISKSKISKRKKLKK